MPSFCFAQKIDPIIQQIRINADSNYVLTNKIHFDSLSNIKQKELRIKLDSIKKTGKLKHLFISSILKTDDTEKSNMLQKSTIYEKFEGRTIDTIFFDSNLPFDDNNSNSFKGWTSRTANKIHSLTKNKVLLKYLLFKSGDKLSSSTMSLNEYILRTLPFIANAYFLIEPNSHNDNVNIIVYTRDNFPIGGDVDFKGKSRDSYFKIYDTNFLGSGNQLYTKFRFNLNDLNFMNAIDLGYKFTNIYKTFFDLNLEVGYGDDYHTLIVNANKNFIEVGDYAGGISYENTRRNESYGIIDTVVNIKKEVGNIWIGKSFKISPKNIGLYITAKSETIKWKQTPYHNRFLNPFFHDTHTLLSSIGIYKESFYRGNLIYGYGYIEDIPRGYKAEIIGGYTWSKDYALPYLGLNGSWGYRNKLGYYNIKISAGTYLNGIAPLERTIFKTELFAFTNLIKYSSQYQSRFFLRASYTNGHNMLNGESQLFSFSGVNRIKGLSTDDLSSTLFYISPEQVIFTPWSILGFKFAPYTYMDFGTLGANYNPFKNPLYSTFGIGIRVKNETLSIPTIQIRLSVVLKGQPNSSSSFFNLSGEERLKLTRFTPNQPKLY